MRIAIPLFGARVAPNFVHAGSMMVIQMMAGEETSRKVVATADLTENEKLQQLEEMGVNILACGGIEKNLIDEMGERGIEVISNTAGEAEEVAKRLIFEKSKTKRTAFRKNIVSTKHDHSSPKTDASSTASADLEPPRSLKREKRESNTNLIDCIECQDRICLKGMYCQKCPMDAVVQQTHGETRKSMEVTLDIALEPERVLCRIAEVVYYCQGMGYKHIGLAFCTDLFPESKTVNSLLRRFFSVTPVCCKVGGVMDKEAKMVEGFDKVHCNPVGMVRILNAAETEINIMLGLCVGCDAIFSQMSLAPVTTLFVKDRLLANNPIGAVYSKYQQEHVLNAI